MFYPLETRVNASTAIRCQRLLPIPGELLVKVGDSVAAEDVVAGAYGQARWRYIPVAATLKTTPAALETHLTKKIGDPIEQGEVIAQRKAGLFTRSCKSPVAGVFAALHHGHVLIKIPGDIIEVRALVRGRIVNVIQELGAIVEARGAQVRAAWSAGHSTWGVIRVLGDSPSAPLRADQIDIRCHGAILAAGWCNDVAALHQADQMQARGVILGSISAEMIPAVRQFSIPIVVTEGFGEIPMNNAAFGIMKAHGGNEISVLCPEEEGTATDIILPIATENAPALPTPPAQLKIGQTVRIIGYPRLGSIGRIASVSAIPRRLDSGALYQGVEVELSQEVTVFVPWMNVEPIA